MTRKHFEAFAAMIRDLRGEMLERDRATVAHKLVPILSEANPNFDALRFIKVCKLELDQ